MPRKVKTLERRFFEQLVIGDGCWTLAGPATPSGYKIIAAGMRGGKNLPAHRVAYELFIGPIPSGLQADHLCHNKACCNPWHIEPVTAQENSRRRSAHLAAKTHCPQGHPYDEANTYVWEKTGHRRCRRCNADIQRERYRRAHAVV